MVFEMYDRSTYIHIPKMDMKSRTPDISKNIKTFSGKQPLSNNLESQYLTTIGSGVASRPSGYLSLINYVKTSGELIAILDAFVTDVLSDGYTFEGTDSKVKLAEQFSEQNHIDSILYNWLLDAFIYGNGFLVMNFVTSNQVKSLMKNVKGYETKEFNRMYYEIKQYADEVASKNMNIQHLPAATVSILSGDKYGNNIIYRQTVGTESVDFNENEVIHIKDIDIDGKLWGFSRIYAIKSELQTLAYTKDYFGLYFQNNATPDMLFIAKNMRYGSEEHKDFVAQLQELKKPENKRKNLLALSDIDVKDLNKLSKENQFTELMRRYVSLLAMTFQMPPSRYGATSNATAEEATLSNQGYYRNISSWQDYIEKTLNTQLFIPIFDVKIKFNRGYKEDELRKVQILKTRNDIVQQLLQLKLIDKKSAVKLLHIGLGLDQSEMITTEDEPEQVLGDSEGEVNSVYRQQNLKDCEMLDEHELNSRLMHTPKKTPVTKKISENKS